MDEKIFDRIEKKYLVTKSQSERILREVKKNMQKDNYYKSEVFNLYFDNDNFDLITQSIDRPVFKHKLRARSYGGYDKVFLEIKTKMRREMLDEGDENVGYKRRVLITNSDFGKLVSGKASVETLALQKIERPADQQIAREVDYMIQYFGLKPQIMVYYDRESFTNDTGLRVTFDRNLKYRTKNLKFNKNARDPSYFEDEKNIIMEIKAHGYLPLWLTKAMSAEQIYPTQFSKIGKIYELIRKEKNV